MTKKIIQRLALFIDRPWYAPLLALIAASDLFVMFWPLDTFLITSSLLRPKQWLRLTLWMTLGSTLGAVAVAWLVQAHGTTLLEVFYPTLTHTPEWQSAKDLVQKYGVLALWFFAIGPFPQPPGVIIVALGGMSLTTIFFTVFFGRIPKWLFFAWAATHTPHIWNGVWMRYAKKRIKKHYGELPDSSDS